jgi:hypothetical protein
MDAGAMHARLEWAIGKLEEWEVRVPPGCRPRNALRALDELQRANFPGGDMNRRIDPITYAAQLHTATELFVIVYAATLADYPDHPFTRERFEAIVRGADGAEGRHTDPRNKEFELSVAARLLLGGIKVFDGEPDLQIEMGAGRWGVAVKRVTSQKGKQMRTRLQDAVDQIERSLLPGIVALKLEGRLEGVTSDPDDPTWFEQADAALDEVARYSAEYLPSHQVRGLLLYSDQSRPTAENTLNRHPVLDTAGVWRHTMFYFPWEDPAPYRTFWAQWRARAQAHVAHSLTDLGSRRQGDA